MVANFYSTVMFHHREKHTNCFGRSQLCSPVCQVIAFNSNVAYFFDDIYWNPIHKWIFVTSLDYRHNGHDGDIPYYSSSIHYLPNEFSMRQEVINLSKTMIRDIKWILPRDSSDLKVINGDNSRSLSSDTILSQKVEYGQYVRHIIKPIQWGVLFVYLVLFILNGIYPYASGLPYCR